MSYALKGFVVVAALAVVGSAFAAPVTVRIEDGPGPCAIADIDQYGQGVYQWIVYGHNVLKPPAAARGVSLWYRTDGTDSRMRRLGVGPRSGVSGPEVTTTDRDGNPVPDDGYVRGPYVRTGYDYASVLDMGFEATVEHAVECVDHEWDARGFYVISRLRVNVGITNTTGEQLTFDLFQYVGGLRNPFLDGAGPDDEVTMVIENGEIVVFQRAADGQGWGDDHWFAGEYASATGNVTASFVAMDVSTESVLYDSLRAGTYTEDYLAEVLESVARGDVEWAIQWHFDLAPGETGSIDKVLFIAVPIPEPMTMSLLALGGLTLLRRRK